MTKITLFVSLCFLLVSLGFSGVTEKDAPQVIPHSLWPIPTQYNYQDTNITINDPCNFSFNVHATNQTIPQVSEIISLYRDYMFKNRGVCIHNPTTLNTNTADANSILNIYISDLSNILMNINTDESYTLHIEDGKFTLNATTYIGFIRGLETFSQLPTPKGGKLP